MTSLSTGLAKAAIFALGLAVMAGQAAAAGQTIRANPTATPLGFSAGDGGQARDEQCGPGHVPCDDIFEKYCAKVLHGTMSGPQGWGGKTCFEPT